MKKSLLFTLLVTLVLVSCSKVPITGRKQLNLVPESQMMEMSATAYSDFLNENPPLPSSNADAQKVSRVGAKISQAVETYLNTHGYKKMANEFNWEFHTVQDPTVNAWCMPGGRVVFYTGILPICENEDGIAAVMGHEVAHAFAKHGQERMTSAYGQQLGGLAVAIGTNNKDPQTQNLWNTIYGIGSQVGMLAYSRTHETEADKLGLVFMTMAGYNPQEAINVWIRMSQRAEGNAPPEFLSTHPSDETRIKNLRAYLPTAIAEAKKYNSQ